MCLATLLSRVNDFNDAPSLARILLVYFSLKFPSVIAFANICRLKAAHSGAKRKIYRNSPVAR